MELARSNKYRIWMVLTHIKHKRILMNPGPLQRILNADRYGATQAGIEFGWIVTHPKSREIEVDRPAKQRI